MAVQLTFTGTVAAAQAAVAAAQAQPGNAAEAASLARLIGPIQTEIAQMNAANQVLVSMFMSHTEKTWTMEVQVDKATPLPLKPGDFIQLSNQSPAN